jgi:hypothetical protein
LDCLKERHIKRERLFVYPGKKIHLCVTHPCELLVHTSDFSKHRNIGELLIGAYCTNLLICPVGNVMAATVCYSVTQIMILETLLVGSFTSNAIPHDNFVHLVCDSFCRDVSADFLD